LIENNLCSLPGKKKGLELQEIHKLVRSAGLRVDRRIRIDPSISAGPNYYNGAVYEVELTLENQKSLFFFF